MVPNESNWATWLKSRPAVVQRTAQQIPPWNTYIVRETGQLAEIEAYAEDGTVRAHVWYQHDGWANGYDVFGLKPEDLQVLPLP